MGLAGFGGGGAPLLLTLGLTAGSEVTQGLLLFIGPSLSSRTRLVDM
jgi:hypothetical protein